MQSTANTKFATTTVTTSTIFTWYAGRSKTEAQAWVGGKVETSYQIIGSQPGMLRVLTSVQGVDGDIVWHRKDTTVKEWQSVHIEIDAQAFYQMEWRVTVQGHDSIILIDNIAVTQGQCSMDVNTCNFEYEGQGADPVCDGYILDTSITEYKFYRTTSLASYGLYARDDHTYGSGLGHFVVADFSKAVTAGELATMMGPMVTDTLGCLTFWYQVDTVDTNVFRVLINSTEEVIFLQEFGSGPVWRLGSGKIIQANKGRIIFEAYSSGTYNGYVAVDDIKLQEILGCPVHGNCDFEEDTCGWSNEGDMQWVFGKNQLPDGPLTLTGLMFVSPETNLIGSKAILTSPILVPYMNCLRFWYLRKQGAPGFLDVKLTPGPQFSGPSFSVKLWQSPSDFLDEWVHAESPIPHRQVDSIQVHFEATRLDGSWTEGHNDGMILVDDIEIDELVEGECQYKPPSAQPPSTVVPPTTIKPPLPPSQASCDFSNQNFCEWRLDASGIVWNIVQGIGNTHSVGPLADHTTGDGYYMSLTPSMKNLEGIAKIISPDMQPAQVFKISHVFLQ
ncbi:hypothetical protein SK128_025177 [Halocaridina rubra]|uniref:MAM domain-containing protein n=1 Tax=Halocaridina rubra TaxID=373956 RepID=A0AAN8WVD0_HALRR